MKVDTQETSLKSAEIIQEEREFSLPDTDVISDSARQGN